MNPIWAGLVIALGLAAAVGLPFWVGRRRAWREASAASVLQEQLAQAVNGVRDLDFDYDMGKIAEADYTTQRKLLIGRGVSLLRRLEEARQQERRLDDDLEAQISAYRSRQPKASKVIR